MLSIAKGHVMKKILLTAAVVLLPSSGFSRDFDNGLTEYKNRDYASALQEWQPLTEQGVAQAQSNLGVKYDRGLTAYKNNDYATALQEWQPLAELGIAKAQSNLGLMYYRGEGVPQDYAKAVLWYKLAAEQELVEAQYKLGLIHIIGGGVLKNLILAHMWLNIAVANGNKDGSTFRDDITKYMAPADITEAQRRARVCMDSNYKNCD